MVAALFVFGVDSNLVWCYTFIYIIKLGAERLKKKREKPEDFIGWKSPDGKLEVIGIAGKTKRGATLFKVICTECSKDKELFPDGCFVSIKGHLKSDQKPCGCASNPKWKDWHYLILARRAGKDRFIVHGFAEEFKNQNTKLSLECLKDGHKWTASINNVINSSRGCPKCSNKYKPTEQEALQKCIDICKEVGYEHVGFPYGYKNCDSRFEYICKIHGKQEISYNNFMRGKRCPCCATYGYNPDKSGSFYVVRWQHKDKKFIKFGITNREVLTRIEEQSHKTVFEYDLIFSASFTDGSIPLKVEKAIKACPEIIKTYVSKEEFPDGFTETTSEYCLDLFEDVVINTLTTT